MILLTERMVAAMRRENLTEEELAIRMGMTPVQLMRYMTGYIETDEETAERFAAVLNVSRDYLFKEAAARMNEPINRIPLLREYPLKMPDRNDLREMMGADYITQYLEKGMEDCFYVVVQDDSMIAAHISEGDRVLVNPRRKAVSGNIVLAKVGGKTVLRRITYGLSQITLSNAGGFPEIETYPESEVEILGTVVLNIASLL